MKTRNWANRMLWFVLGCVVTGLLAVATPSRSEPVQDYCQQEIASLKQRIAALEQYNINREKADKMEAERKAREETNQRNRDKY